MIVRRSYGAAFPGSSRSLFPDLLLPGQSGVVTVDAAVNTPAELQTVQPAKAQAIAAQAQPPVINIAPPPPVVVQTAAPPQIVTTAVEKIPLSDPRHPQHAEWLAQQEDENSFLSRYGLWVGLGAAALVLGGVFLLRPAVPQQ